MSRMRPVHSKKFHILTCSRGATVSGGCQGHFASLVINQMLVDGSLTNHIEQTLIPTYRKRYSIFVQAIKQYLYPYGIEIVAHDQSLTSGYAGGFFLYLTFEHCRGANASDVAKMALADFNLRVAPGEIFAVPDDPESKIRGKTTWYNGIRLCWAWNEDEALVEGIQRLAKVVETVIRTA